MAVGVAAVFSFYSTQQAEKAKNAAEETRRALEAKTQQAQLDIKAYELVERALSLEPDKRQQHVLAAAAIVNALTNPPLRDGLQGALSVGAVGDQTLSKHIDDARQFDLDEYGVAPTSPPAAQPAKRSSLDESWHVFPISAAFAQPGGAPLRNYRVDLFYCEAASQQVTDSRKTRANDAAARLQKSGSGAVVRVRLLPVLVQARPGYHSSSDEIRFNDAGDEKAAAAQLAKTIGINERDVHQIDFATPGYLSVFYCADR